MCANGEREGLTESKRDKVMYTPQCIEKRFRNAAETENSQKYTFKTLDVDELSFKSRRETEIERKF